MDVLIYILMPVIKLDVVISHNGKPIASYIRKLTPAQSRYTVKKKGLTSTVETLK